MKETLGQYVDRIMRQKKLTIRDVEKRCDKKLTHSYVARIVKGKVKNPTLATMLALAKGLDEDLYQVVAVASGQPFQKKQIVDPLYLLALMQKAILNPELLDVIDGWERLPKKLRETIVYAIKQAKVQSKKKPSSKR